MRIAIPIVPIELEITARRRVTPYRIRVRTLLIIVAAVAVIVYLCLPFSTADRELMARYELLGNNQPKPDLTKSEVINRIGPPSTTRIPGPNMCVEYTWVAHFDRPLSHQVFELGLQLDPRDEQVAAWKLDKTEYQGLTLILYRVGRLLQRMSF